MNTELAPWHGSANQNDSLIVLPRPVHATVRIAAIVPLLLVVALLTPVMLIGWTFPSGRELLQNLLIQLRVWTSQIVGEEDSGRAHMIE